MKDLISASQQARENRKKKAKEQLASDDFIKQLQQSENLENSTLRGFKALIMYMEGKTTKTEVVNQLKSVSTPDVDKVVKALEKLEKKTADNKIDLKPLSDDLKKLETQLSKIPKELPKIPEGKDKVEVTNLKAVTTAIANVEKSVKKIKMVAEAPKVSVSPKITVEKPDLEPLQKIFLDLLERINPPQDWEFPVTDLSKLEKEVQESNKKLQIIADKKVPLPPSMAGVIEAINNSGGGGGGGAVTSATHDNFNVNANLQVGDTDVSTSNPVPTTTSIYKKLIDDTTTANVTYIGEAALGTATSASTWRIQKVDESGSPTSITWTGTGFTAVWDDRVTESYL